MDIQAIAQILLKLGLAQSENYLIQNRYYNGWTGSCHVNSVFVFAPYRKIKMAAINAPGCWHDSTIAEHGVYNRIGEVHKKYGGKIVVNSAFNVKAHSDYLIRSSQKDPASAEGLILNRDATSVQQLSEWGMRQLQGQFPRMKDPLPYEEFGERRVTINLMVVLYNYQASKVGINQILNSYMSNTDGFFSYHITSDANNVFGSESTVS